ncbi:SDO1-like protein C21C3.19 like [Verticillium longisporum]|nr:SDO1-like protein C21C3.19 like [Verticillium longisporum]
MEPAAIMVRGEVSQTKVTYKIANSEFSVLVEDPETYKKWQDDKSVPLAHFISAFKIFIGNSHLDTASKQELENAFGSEDEDKVIKQILEKGDAQPYEMAGRQGPKNDSKGPMAAH